jgi:hypothetical protein
MKPQHDDLIRTRNLTRANQRGDLHFYFFTHKFNGPHKRSAAIPGIQGPGSRRRPLGGFPNGRALGLDD